MDNTKTTGILSGVALVSFSMHLAGAYFTIYLLQNGIGMKMIALFYSINRLSLLFAEYPSGILADYYGRLKSAMLGAFLYGLGILMLLTPTLPAVLPSSMLCGLGTAFLSGSIEAWIYESYSGNVLKRVISLERAIGPLTGAIAGVLALELTRISMQLVFLVSGIGAILALAFFLPLPDNKWKGAHRNLFTQSIKMLGRRDFLSLVVYHSIISCVMMGFFVVWSPTLVDRGLEEQLLGIVYSILLISTTIGSLTASRVFRYISPERWLSLFGPAVALLYAAVIYIDHALATIIMFAFLEFLLGIYTVSLVLIRNQLIPSNIRASAISLMSFVSSLVTVALLPLNCWE